LSSDTATNEHAAALGASPRRDWPLLVGRVLWGLNVALLAALALWIFSDPLFAGTARWVAARIHLFRGGIVATVGDVAQVGWRLPTLWAAIVTAIASLLLLGLMLFIGSATHRRLRSWLAYTMLVAAWLTMLVAWREFAWQGQRLRLRSTVNEFDALAKSLRENWPNADGERAGLGSFMAYPQGTPRMLMMLVSETQPQIAAIERGADGSLGFEIRGEEPGTWLEWHPAGSAPKNFVGGLEAEYDLRRTAPLGRGWYLVRYR
jgi:hypothetical protein